jgi:hypothetical protein
MIQDRINDLGGRYMKSDEIWVVRTVPAVLRPSANIDLHPQPKVVRSGNLLTGQNPNSAGPLAEEIKKALQTNVKLI